MGKEDEMNLWFDYIEWFNFDKEIINVIELDLFIFDVYELVKIINRCNCLWIVINFDICKVLMIYNFWEDDKKWLNLYYECWNNFLIWLLIYFW